MIWYATLVALLALAVYGLMHAALLHRLRRALSIQADYAQGLSTRSHAAAG